MADVLRPDSEDRLAEVISWAAGEDQPLEVIGLGTKRALGHEVEADYTLDLSAFSGIRQYEPAELVMTLGPATPLLEVQKLLHDNQQMLAFEPPNAGRLLQGQSLPGSIGGVVGCGLSGPRRFRAGAVRDHVLGIRGVTGRGEVFKSGGKVVKNVTGYDLSKVLTGSYGTLAALTEVTLKVLPAP
ncbi:MAG: FAD-binding protein, partial [Alphaproteobacteria bacterium]|nr:FAD-binding protein [Alphaproteobacteria bacterium]